MFEHLEYLSSKYILKTASFIHSEIAQKLFVWLCVLVFHLGIMIL